MCQAGRWASLRLGEWTHVGKGTSFGLGSIIIGDRGKCGKDRARAHPICPVCYLLGAQGLVGFVTVPFLFSDIRYDGLYSARLERTSQTVMKESNRSYQLVPPQTVFTGTLEVLAEDPLISWKLSTARPLKEITSGDVWLNDQSNWNQEKVLKEMVQDRFKAIQRLGGYRSKGFGKVEIAVSEKT